MFDLPLRARPKAVVEGVALVVAVLLAAPGCSGGSGGGAQDGGTGGAPADGATGGTDGTAGGSGDVAGGDAGGADVAGSGDAAGPSGVCPAGAAEPSQPVWIVFGRRGRVPGENQGVQELYLADAHGGNPFDPTQPDPVSLTDFSLKGQTFRWCSQSPELPISCERSCRVDDGLNWMLVELPPPPPGAWDPSSPVHDPQSDKYDPDYASCLDDPVPPEVPDPSLGGTFALARRQAGFKFKVIKDLRLTNIAHAEFSGKYLYFTKKLDCTGPSCQFSVHRIDLTQGSLQVEDVLPGFPPGDFVGESIYTGWFFAGANGEALAFENPTIRSQSWWFWTQGTLSHVYEVCLQKQNDACIGAGSEYRDTDPLAISPDAQWITSFSVSEGNLRVWRFATQQELPPMWTNLVSVPPGSNYSTSACDYITEPWQFKEIREVQEAPEGQSILYLGFSDCGGPASKPATDILELPLDVIGNGLPLSETNVKRITRNPRDNTPNNIRIDTFDVCPGGDALVFSGTPSVDEQGFPLPRDSKSARNDRELYIIGRDGCGLKQLTRDVAWEVVSVQCIPAQTP